jgi:hypothetical protein
VCSFREVSLNPVNRSHSNPGRSFAGAPQTSQLVQIVPPQQIAHERLDDRVHFPLGPVLVPQQILDAAPARRAVILAALAFVKKFAMLLTDILFIFLTISDFHVPLLVLRRRFIWLTRCIF